MTKQEFAQQIKAKYPEYQNLDDNELADKIIAKYPVYQSQITEEKPQESLLKKVGDFFTGSTQKFAKTLGTAASVIDPETKRLREEAINSTNKMVDELMARAKKEPDKEKVKKILESASKLADTENIDIYNNPEYQKTAKQIIGEGIGTGLEALSFGTFGKAAGVASKVPTLIKPIVSPAKKVLTGIAEGAKIGATFGGVSGLSQSLQENKSAADIAKETALGAGLGGLTGGALGGTISGSAALLNKGIELTKNATTKLGKIAEQKLYNTASDLVKMSPTAIRKETTFGKNTPKFITEEGILPLIESEGNKINTDKALDALSMKYGEEANAFKSILKDSGEYVSLNDLQNKTLADIEKFKSKGSDYKDAIKYVKSEINSYKNNYKDISLTKGDDVLVPLDKFNEIKSGLWGKTNFNATQKEALFSNLNFKMGNSAKQIIENKLTDVDSKAMNSRLGDFISAIKVLENANGKVLPGGFFGKQFTRIAGTIGGAAGGGLPGSIVGNITGGVLADMASNPKIRTGLLYKVYSRLQKQGKTGIIDEAQKILEKRGEERASRKLLEAPKSIQVGGKADTSRLFTQEEAQILLDSMKIKEAPKLLKAPLGDKTNPILLSSPKINVKNTTPTGKNREFATNISGEYKNIENRAFNKIDNSYQEILNDYENKNGNVVNADSFRPYFKDEGYVGSNAAAVQEPSSELAKIAWENGLKKNGQFATLFAGGSGTGKTSAIKNIDLAKEMVDNSAVILDGNLSSYSSAMKKIKQANDAGKVSPILYVYREPVDSMVNGVVKRSINNQDELGRIVPTKVVAENHIGSWETIKRLAEEGNTVISIDNSLGAKKAKIVPLKDLSQKVKYPSVEELTKSLNEEIKRLYENKIKIGKRAITEEEYKAYVK